MRKVYVFAILCLFISGINAQVNINAPWTWVSGEKHLPMRPIIVAKNVSSTVNNPGGRKDAASWSKDGVTWMFGGYGYGGNSLGYLNDLWKYDQATKEWTWVNGDNITDVFGVYGTIGVPDDNNKPGSRREPSTWTGTDGNFYLFGGWGYSASGGPSKLNDLWRYNPQTNQWTWLGGPTTGNTITVYGTIGVADVANWPGARSGATLWLDNDNNVWMFGGDGYAKTVMIGRLNDTWKYDPVTSVWTWMNGADSVNSPGDATTPSGRNAGNTSWKDQSGVFYMYGGTTGGPAGAITTPPCGYCASYQLLNDFWKFNSATNIWTKINRAPMNGTPSPRTEAMTWVDDTGIFWLFGGWIWDRYSNDLWKYNPADNQWTKVRGINQEIIFGTYGVQGVTAFTNERGGRASGITWKDHSGKLYSFGGDFQENYPVTYRNDIWAYDQSINMYTWEKGDTAGTYKPHYTAVGVADPVNRPGERRGAEAWYDNNGNLWLFGGNKRPVLDVPVEFNLRDLWKYNISSGQWTMVKNPTGGYTTQGVADPAMGPFGREAGSTWTDNSNNLWLFGGWTGSGFMNDLFKYDIASNAWTWVHGTNTVNSSGFSNGSYGTKGVASPTNMPSTRQAGANWKDNAGNFWIFGGSGSPGSNNWINDLWKYDIVSNQWTWMSGDNVVNQTGVYGIKGIAASTNKPGARFGSASWTDNSGNLWLFGGFYRNNSFFNDLWKYDVTSNEWTWISGDDTFNNAGVYGTRGVASSANKPGARTRTATWTDANGNFWMMGGQGYDASAVLGYLNDLWMYNPTTNEWTWVKGDIAVNTNGVYGVRNVGHIDNKPGSRFATAVWKDGVGDFWLYGGFGFAEDGQDRLSDLWKISPALSAPLPVRLLEFKGRLVNDDGVLNWKTENEENASAYIVERSTDRRNYIAVGTIAAKNTTGTHHYGFTDPDIDMLGAPVVYYRLKQKDIDGKFVYSTIIALTIDRSLLVFFYPNPVIKTANVTITANKSELLQIKIISSSGAVVKQMQWKLSSGSTSQSIDLAALSGGAYYLELTGETLIKRISFIKQ